MEQITLVEAKKILSSLKDVMSQNKQMLIDIDSVMGDGDLGLTMDKIFTEAADKMADKDGMPLGKFFTQAGMLMAKAAPSTMGTLMGGTFMTAGKEMGDKDSWDGKDLVAFYMALANGIMTRGKAKVGEKTIVDVLYPVASDLENSGTTDIKTIVVEAHSKSKEYLEKTKDMVAQHGRAAYYQEKSKGHADAGACVAVLLFESFEKALS